MSEQRGKERLLPLLPFGIIYTGLGGWQAAEKTSTFSGVSLVSR